MRLFPVAITIFRDFDTVLSAQKLRKEVFVKELDWLACEYEREFDFYDSFSSFLGVFSGKKRILAGHMRVISYRHHWMFDDPFKNVFPKKTHNYYVERFKTKRTVEYTRYFVSKDFRNLNEAGYPTNNGRASVSTFVLMGAFQTSILNGIDLGYCCVTRKIFRLLRLQGWPILQFGPSVKLNPEHEEVLPCVVDWRLIKENSLTSFLWSGRKPPYDSKEIRLPKSLKRRNFEHAFTNPTCPLLPNKK